MSNNTRTEYGVVPSNHAPTGHPVPERSQGDIWLPNIRDDKARTLGDYIKVVNERAKL